MVTQNEYNEKKTVVKSKKRCKGKDLLSLKEMTEEELRLHRNVEILRMMPDNIADVLAKARNKPVWCSDVRWRMELGRRRYSRYS